LGCFEEKYDTAEAGAKKYDVILSLKFQMTDDKSIEGTQERVLDCVFFFIKYFLS
jgi:hypothetical protein